MFAEISLHLAEFLRLNSATFAFSHMRPLRQTATRTRTTRFPRLLVLALICWLSALFTTNAHAAFGDLVAQYGFPASAFVMSPTQPLMYATIPSQNSIAIINTNTLAASTVFVGSGPTNLALSPDGSKAYIANSTTNFVVVFDTQTRTVTNSFLLPEQPQDVVCGSLNRLWVLGEDQIFQIDATTGASTGPSISGNAFIYSGSLEISPDRNTLYYADYGLSPGTMYKFAVSGTTPALVLQTQFGTVGSNGEDLTLSHNGNFICYTTGSGQNLYDIAKFRTSDFASLGSFNTGPYPQALAFSPDDSVVYASVATASGIKVYNANTFSLLGTISGPNEAIKLAVDSTGRYLFAGYTETFGDFVGTRVYDTGFTNTMIWYLNNNVFTDSADGPITPAGWRVAGAADFNRDGHPDYLLFNPATHGTVIWYMNKNVHVGSASGPALPAGWSVGALADFNGDGYPDYLLYNTTTRETVIWYMRNNVHIGSLSGPTLPAGWSLAAVADFNRDGRHPDYLLFNSTSGATVIWYMNNNVHIGSSPGPTLPGGWSVVAVADFNGDGYPDYLLNHGRGTVIWYMQNNVRIGSVSGPTLPPAWSVAGVADFNGDGHPDYLIFNQGL
jgi:YVTN family beta-propeller protein